MIKAIRPVGAAELDKIICQSSPAVRGMHATLTRKAIAKDVRKANRKMAATISIVIEKIAQILFGQNSSRAMNRSGLIGGSNS
jgi:hypothetical protein